MHQNLLFSAPVAEQQVFLSGNGWQILHQSACELVCTVCKVSDVHMLLAVVELLQTEVYNSRIKRKIQIERGRWLS